MVNTKQGKTLKLVGKRTRVRCFNLSEYKFSWKGRQHFTNNQPESSGRNVLSESQLPLMSVISYGISIRYTKSLSNAVPVYSLRGVGK